MIMVSRIYARGYNANMGDVWKEHYYIMFNIKLYLQGAPKSTP